LQEINIDSLNDIAILGFLQHHNCPTPLLDWTYSFKTAMFFGIDGLEKSESAREIDHYFSVYFIEEEHFDGGSMRNLLNGSLQEVGDELKLKLISQIANDEEQRKEMEEHFKGRSFFDKQRIKGAGLISYMTKINHMMNIPLSYFSDKDIEAGIAFSITNSNNIKSQNGVFTWNSDVSKPLEVVGNEQYNEAKLDSDPNDYRFCECYNIHKSLSDYIAQRLKENEITLDEIYPDKDVDARNVYNESKKV
ncbi:MAG: FRG domain-containing protein, partial [Sphingobacteriales bacterium]